jgi:uncharacterized NAD(P)/FAD-binding protein YdhS
MTQQGRRIAIIGAGFSGSLLAVHLLRRSHPEDRIYLIERSAEFGRGLAYATGNPRHLLNVRADNMSAFSDRPDHFLDWIRDLPEEERGPVNTTADRLTFVSRSLYGAYIQHILAQEIWGSDCAHRLYLVADEAVALHPTSPGYRVEVAGGRQFQIDAVALAVGNFPPDGTPPGCAANPWDIDVVTSLDADAAVLLIGTGLTMVDVVISLLDRRHRGEIRAISRRGLLPRTHAAVLPHRRFLPASTAPRSILGLLRALRSEIRDATAQGRDWRSVIDSLRPDTQDLWRNLPLEEKRRFLRHLRPWWDVHRHRMAPAVAARIAGALNRGQLVIQRARLGRVTAGGGATGREAFEVELRAVDGAPPSPLSVARIINCSGPVSDVSRVQAPLIRALLNSGRVRADALGLGLDVTSRGAVIDRFGRPSDSLFAVGPITKGAFWETTAVPDIRLQCERLAEHLLEQLDASPVLAPSLAGRSAGGWTGSGATVWGMPTAP